MPAVNRLSSHAWLLLIVFATALGVRLWGIGFGLPHPMTRPDEEFLIAVALRFFAGDFNPHFFEWPSLYFYIVHAALRVAYVVGGYHDPAAFVAAVSRDQGWAHLMLRAMSLVAGMGTIAVVYRLARRLFTADTGVVAAAFLAVAYLHVRDSHFGVLDVPLTFAIVCTVALVARAWLDEHAVRWFALAGLAAGLATSIKYNAGVLIVPALAAAAVRLRDGLPEERGRISAAAALFLAAFAVGFVAGTPYAVLDPNAFREGLSAQVTRLTEGHGIRIERVWWRHLTFSLFHGVGWPVLAAGAIGGGWLALTDWRRAAIVLSFPLVYFAVIGGGHTAFIRYVTPLVPFVCIGAAFAVDRGLRASMPRTWSGRARAIAMVGVVLLLALPSMVTVVRFDRVLTRTDTRVLAAAWLRGAIQPGQSLYESGASYVRPHFAWTTPVVVVQTEFDERRSTFVTPAGQPIVPDWVVLAESPLRLYTAVPGALRGILSARYQKVLEVSPSREPEPESIFDRQDAFFLPFADFDARDRPGPTLTIYRLSTR
jgi:4-amino-4-deoxy-L-arabinose transferase-like glycosyltransferase